MKLILCALAVVVVAGVTVAMPLEDDGTKTVPELWTQWKTENSKTYATPEEEARRLEIFTDNKKRIDEHNEKYKRGEVTWTQGLTNFADLTPEEFKRRHLGGIRRPDAKNE